MAVAPEVLVVVLDGLAHVPQPVGGDDEVQFWFFHDLGFGEDYLMAGSA